MSENDEYTIFVYGIPTNCPICPINSICLKTSICPIRQDVRELFEKIGKVKSVYISPSEYPLTYGLVYERN